MVRAGRGYPVRNTTHGQEYLPILFDSVGAGNGTTGAATLSETHIISPRASIVLASLTFSPTTAGANPIPYTSAVVTCGTKTMIPLEVTTSSDGDGDGIALYYVMGPPSGSQTIEANNGSTAFSGAINSVSYINVAGVGTPQYYVGTASPLSASYAAPYWQKLVCCGGFRGASFSASIGGFSGAGQNTRWNWSMAAHSAGQPAILGDAPGGGSIDFITTLSGMYSAWWGAAIVPLIPMRTSAI